MELHWTNDLAVGIDEIDQQHKELIERVRALVDACQEGRCLREAAETMRFLDDYVVRHFSAEEQIMEQREYPDRAEHRREHQAFREKLAHLERRFANPQETPQAIAEFNALLVDWLIDHICTVDRALGKFLQKN